MKIRLGMNIDLEIEDGIIETIKFHVICVLYVVVKYTERTAHNSAQSTRSCDYKSLLNSSLVLLCFMNVENGKNFRCIFS